MHHCHPHVCHPAQKSEHLPLPTPAAPMSGERGAEPDKGGDKVSGGAAEPPGSTEVRSTKVETEGGPAGGAAGATQPAGGLAKAVQPAGGTAGAVQPAVVQPVAKEHAPPSKWVMGVEERQRGAVIMYRI